MPQGSQNSLNPVARIGDQIAAGMVAHGVREGDARRKVADLLSKVGLDAKVTIDRVFDTAIRKFRFASNR